MQIYWSKRKRLHKKRVQLPEDWFGTPTWPSFHCFRTPIWPPWRHVITPYMGTCRNHDKYRTMSMHNLMFIMFATGAGVRVVEIQAVAFQAKLVLWFRRPLQTDREPCQDHTTLRQIRYLCLTACIVYFVNSCVAGADIEYVASLASSKPENPLCVPFVRKWLCLDWGVS